MGKSSYTASTISISLLLLLLGVVGYFMLGAKKTLNDFSSGISIHLFLEQDATQSQRAEIERRIKADKDILSVSYVSTDKAVADFEKKTGIIVDTTYGSNPIPASYEIKPKSVDVSAVIQERAEQWPGVESSFYPTEVAKELTRKINFLWQIGLYGGALLLLVALSLIYYTLKLSILGSAQEIRTMQLVGARNGFIKRPYIRRSIVQGFVAAVISTGLLILFLEIFANAMNLTIVRDDQYWKEIAMIGSVLCLTGIIICSLFTIVVLGIIVKNRRQ